MATGRATVAGALIAGLLGVAGCGDQPTRVEIIHRDGPDSPPTTAELQCPSDRYPAACDDLRRLPDIIWQPVREDRACTAHDAGSATARIRGVIDGEQIDQTYNRHNGCEIHRFALLHRILLVATAPRRADVQ